MSGLRERRQTIAAVDGIHLQSWLATPPQAPIAALVLCHGVTTDATEHGAFLALRDRALRAGMAVARMDFRAHGSSEGSNQHLTLAGLRADVDALLALVNEQLGSDLPVIPVGVSFGGAAAIHAAASHNRCAGLVLWYAVVDYAFNFGADSPIPFTRQMREAADPQRDPPWAAMPLIGTGYYLPTALLQAAEEDTTPRTLAALTHPVLCYYGSRDRLVGLEPLRRLRNSRSNIDLRVARGAGHGFLLWRPWVIRRTCLWALRQAQALVASR